MTIQRSRREKTNANTNFGDHPPLWGGGAKTVNYNKNWLKLRFLKNRKNKKKTVKFYVWGYAGRRT